MSLNEEQLQKHCETIISSPEINKKLVVLCEGEIEKIEISPSPQSYRKNGSSYRRKEPRPDAIFYSKCIPRWWKHNQPRFINCGDRKDVIDTYITLVKLHHENSSNSYLSPEKLFAIVDLDLQVQKIDDYPFPDTEAIFRDLYHEAKVNEQNAPQHHIWVTGLIHKEAYFLMPELEQIFNDPRFAPIYKDKPLQLEKIYLDMAEGISSDPDLEHNLQRVCDRISYCSGLDFNGIDKLRHSWIEQFKNSQDKTRKKELICALLTFKKAKDYWKQIYPPSDYTSPVERFREQLSLEIGRFYSRQSKDVQDHIPCFFKTLYRAGHRK